MEKENAPIILLPGKKSQAISLIIIIVLLVSFLLMTFFGGKSMKELRENNRMLKDSVTSIQVQRDSLKKDRLKLEGKYDTLKLNVDKKEHELSQINHKLVKVNHELHDAVVKVNHYKSQFDSIEYKVHKLKEEPIKRTGDQLLNSLKEKTKK